LLEDTAPSAAGAVRTAALQVEALTAEVAVVEAPAADLTEEEAAEAHPVQAAVVLLGVVVGAAAIAKAVSQLVRPDKYRKEWFSLGENHEKVLGFGLHQFRNLAKGFWRPS
jgi:hypothetical protein